MFVGPSMWAVGDSDPLFSLVKLLYHFDGTWANTIGGTALTTSGGAAITGSGKWGSAGDFSSSTNDLATSAGGIASFSSSDDFCFEFWFYNPNLLASTTLLNFTRFGGGGSLTADMSGTNFWLSFGAYTSSMFALSKLAWHHVALTRKSGIMKAWADGALQHTGGASNTLDYNGGGTLFLGRSTGTNSGARCLTDDLRFTVGASGSGAHRYDNGGSTYAIPTSAFPNG